MFLSRNNQAAAFYLMPSRFWELSAGCLSLLAITQWPQLRVKLKWFAPEIMMILMIFILHLVVKTRESIAIVALTSLLLIRLQPSDFTYRVLCTTILQWLGKISYSLYLWHWIILVISRWTIGIHAWTVPIQIGLMLAAASLSHDMVEKPLRHSTWGSTNLQTIIYGIFGTTLGSAAMMIALIPGVSLYLGNRQGVLSKDEFLHNAYKVEGTPGKWEGTPCILGSGKDLGKGIEISHCTLGDYLKAKRRVLVRGNSFSAAFSHAFDQLVQKDQYAIIITSSFGASPTSGIKLNNGFDALSNDYWKRVVPKLINSLQPGDLILMINDVGDLLPARQNLDSKELIQTFESDIIHFSSLMKNKGIQVLLTRSLPFARDAKCEPTVAATQWFNQIGESPCEYLTRKETLARMKYLDQVLDRLEQKGVLKTIDLMPIFCPGKICNYNGPGGIILYRDAKSHPTEEAAELSGKIIRDAIINQASVQGASKD
jgi:hypothetical protein